MSDLGTLKSSSYLFAGDHRIHANAAIHDIQRLRLHRNRPRRDRWILRIRLEEIDDL